VLSRIHPKKGLDVLIEAFASLLQRAEFQNWRLVIAGEGEADYLASLKRIVDERNATEFVVFPGWLQGEHKEVALTNASLLALPSYQENFGLCVMEALASGVPVLISPHVNLAPDIHAAKAGWIVPVEIAALKTALADALGDQAERTKRGLAGAEFSNEFTWPAVAAKLVEVYSQILSEQR